MAAGGVKVVVTAIVGNSAVTVAKFTGWVFTGSASMLAEAIHSAADTSNQILLLVGIKQSEKGPTRIFPFGKGQARYVWNLISAMGIFFIGFGFTTWHGVSALMHPHHSDAGANDFKILMGILTFALIVEGYAFWVAYKETNRQRGKVAWLDFFNRSDDPTTVGVLFEDAVAVLGVIVAFLCIVATKALGIESADAIGSIIIGVLMGIMALFLAYVNGRLLIGTSVHVSKVSDIKEFVETQPNIERVMNIKAVTVGSGQTLLTLEVELHGRKMVDPAQISADCSKLKAGEDPARVLTDTAGRMVRVVGEEINSLEHKLKEKYPSLLSIEIEVH